MAPHRTKLTKKQHIIVFLFVAYQQCLPFFFSLLILKCLPTKKKNEEKQKKIRTNYTGAEF